MHQIYIQYVGVCTVYIQYVGQTTYRFRYRWNNSKACYCRACRRAEVPQKHLHKHFMGGNHQGLEKDVEITLIEKTNPSDPTKRKDFWICASGSTATKGLNVALF